MSTVWSTLCQTHYEWSEVVELSITRAELDALIERQLSTLFLLPARDVPRLKEAIAVALASAEYCFAHISNKYYRRNGEVYFNPFHSAQYCIFLYFLSVAAAKGSTDRLLADRIYYLNRALNGVDLFYDVALPRVFAVDHPLGSVMGRARYGEYFRFAQGCTVGNNKGIYPVIGEHVTMMSGAKILGCCHVGDHVTIAANAYVKDTNIPPNSIVFGSSPQLVVKPKSAADTPGRAP